jgi:hypothetical protein
VITIIDNTKGLEEGSIRDSAEEAARIEWTATYELSRQSCEVATSS